MRFQQEIHRPVQLLNLNGFQPVNMSDILNPRLRSQLATRIQRTIGNQREQQPLNRNAKLPLASQLPKHFTDTQPLPQTIQQVSPAVLLRSQKLERNFQAHILPDYSRILGIKETSHAADQPLQRLGIQPVLAPETMNDVHAALPVHPLVMSKLHVLNPV